jgi:hypothetical protein
MNTPANSPTSTPASSSTSAPARLSRLRQGLPGAGAVLVGTLLICAHASLYGRWLVDDAAITFDYARNITLGFGPVAQPGATPVEGYSNSTWLALLILGRWLGLFDHGSIMGVPDYVVYPKLLAVLFCAGTLVAFHRIAAVLVRRPWIVTLGSGMLSACIPSYVAWCFSGLENSLYACTVTVIAAVTVRAITDDGIYERVPAVASGLLAALAALTRPDGMIFAVAFPAVALLLITRRSVRTTVTTAALSLGSFAVPFGLFLLWRHAEFGRYVSNTTAAKDQALSPNAQTVTAFNKIGDLIAYVGVVGALVALVVIGSTLGRPSFFRRRLVGVLVPLALAVTAFGVLQPDWMNQYRFATPIWALGSLTVTVCAYQVLASTSVRTRAVCCLGIVAALGMSLTLLKQDEAAFRAAPTVPLCFVADSAGRATNELADVLHLGDDATYLGPDLGGSSLTLRLRIVDLAGLTDARIADYRADDDLRGLAGYVFGTVRPALINAEGPWKLTGLDPRLDTDYYLLDATGPPDPDNLDDAPNPDDGGLYVRRDVVPDVAALARAKAVEQAAHAAVVAAYRAAPRSSCGDTLSKGQVLIGLR